MANVVITLRIMPESPETDLKAIEEKVSRQITKFAGEGQIKIEQKPVAFGLKAVEFTFVMDEAKGSTEALESRIREMDGVNSAEVTDVRRAVG
ncbi:MAG TPA: elongation factor 1-beta [Candidatus Nanoarchaeia archaeon]|nr:elongation factor 1-beta [Candidatus Nanoarchaeia archaeon]